MNFNITSPLDSASNFTARFKEDIIIPKNSSAFINHIKILRDRRITLLENNTIDLVFEDPIPAFKANGALPKLPCLPDTELNRITLPKGVYSGANLTTEINKRIQSLFNRNNGDQNTRGFYNCGTLNVQDFRTNANDIQQNREEDSVVLSTIINDPEDFSSNAPADLDNDIYVNSYEHSEYVVDAPNSFQSTNGDSVNTPAYTNTTATAPTTYNNYGLSIDPVRHYAINASDYATEGFSQGGQNNTVLPGISNAGDYELQYNKMPRIHAITRQNLNGIVAAGTINAPHFIGLYSQPYASGLPQINPANLATMGFSTNPNRIAGNATPTLDPVLGVPICFLGVEIGRPSVNTAGSAKTITIFGGAQSTGAGLVPMSDPVVFPHGGALVDRMVQLAIIDLDDDAEDGRPFCDDDDQVEVVICPFYRTQHYSDRTESGTNPNPVGFPNHRVYSGFVNRRFLHFQIMLKSRGRFVEVYNTLDGGGSISGTFLEGGNTTFGNTQSDDMVNMNFPLHTIASVKNNTASGAGWQKINATFTDREGGTNNTNAPLNIIHGMRYRVSKELATYIDSAMAHEQDPNTPARNIPNQLTTTANYPSIQARHFGYFPMLPPWASMDFLSPVFACAQVFNNMYADSIDDSYTIYITNLPLKNYKNSRETRRPSETKGGYSKNILANIPLPYQTNYIVGTNLIGYYEPFNKPITELRNQTFKTNYFTVEIRNAKDDSPAKYLRSATINFTIVDKKSKLIN